MKFLQCAVCSFALTLTAAAQMTPASPSSSSSQSANPQATAPKITNLDGEEVKGPEHPLTLDQMKVLFVEMGYEKTINDNTQRMISTNKTRAAYIPVDFWDDLDSSFQKIDYPTALLDVYKKYLSTEDAAKLIDFGKTEAGKHFLETLPETSRGAMAAIQRQQQQTGMQVQARHKDEIEAAMKKYRDEQAAKQAPPASAKPATPSTATPNASPAPNATSTKPATPPASTTPQN